MQRFTDLTVWQLGHELALDVYRVSKAFPADERFGLTSQLRRAAVSIPANIAEGSKRKHPADYARFLNIAEGSLAEAEYLMMLGRDLGYLDAFEPLHTKTRELAVKLHRLRRTVEA